MKATEYLKKHTENSFVSVEKCQWCENMVLREFLIVEMKLAYRCESCGKEFIQ